MTVPANDVSSPAPRVSGAGETLQGAEIFSASVDSVRLVAPLARAVQAKCWVQVCVSRRGIKLAGGDALLHAAAYLQHELFHPFRYAPEDDDEELVLTVDAAALVDALSMHLDEAPATGTLRYVDGPLEVTVDEAGDMSTTWRLTAYEAPDDAEAAAIASEAWASHPLRARVILAADWLNDALHECGAAPKADGAIRIAVDPSGVAVSARGDLGGTEVRLARESSVLEVLEIEPDEDGEQLITVRFPARSLAHVCRALALASKTSMRINAQGYMSVQCMVQLSDTQACFVEYLAAPVEELVAWS